MKYLLIIMSLFFSFSYGQNIEKASTKKFIFIGESHFCTGNSEIELNLIDELLQESDYDNITIMFEFSPTLEYFLRLEDYKMLKDYYIHNADRAFTPDTLTVHNKKNYLFVKELDKVISNHKDKRIRINCMDVHYAVRPLYYTLKTIFEKSKTKELYNKFFNGFNTKVVEKTRRPIKTDLYFEIKKEFSENKYKYKNNFDSLEYHYLKKIFDTPVFTNYKRSRDSYMFSAVKYMGNYNNQIIFIVGSGHVRTMMENNLYNKLKREYSSFFKRPLFSFGIIPVNGILQGDTISNSYTNQFDEIIYNKDGEKYMIVPADKACIKSKKNR